MLTRDEVERLIRISREFHMNYNEEYEKAYTRVDAVKGHKARMAELDLVEKEAKETYFASRRTGAKEALDVLAALAFDYIGECSLSRIEGVCKQCPFSLGGPCALKTIIHDRDMNRPAIYPRNCMEEISKGVKAQAWENISDKKREYVKKAYNKLLRSEGKPEVE